jgi:hypothetical protein
MCALGVVGLLLWARLMLLENVTRSGYAQPDSVKSDGAGGAGSADSSRSHVERRTLYVDVPETLTRNLFAAPQGMFPQTTQAVVPKSDEPKYETDTPEETVETPRQRAERIRKDAGMLTLESVLLGRTPVAVINGRMLKTGDTIKGFSIEEIRERSVLVRQEDVRVEITMKVP